MAEYDNRDQSPSMEDDVRHREADETSSNATDKSDQQQSEAMMTNKKNKEKAQSNWSKIFRPWRWKRKKKSEKFKNTATNLERKISVRSAREDLIKRGVLIEPNHQTENSIPEIEENNLHKTAPSGDQYTVVMRNHNTDDQNENDQPHFIIPNNIPEDNEASYKSGATDDQDRKNHRKIYSYAEDNPSDQENDDQSHPSRVVQPPKMYSHKKYPSDIPQSTNVENTHQPVSHRHSYQVATNNAPIVMSEDSQKMPRFQVKGQPGNNVMAVVSGGSKGGPMVIGVKRVSNDNIKMVHKPQPKPRTRPDPLPSKPPPPPMHDSDIESEEEDGRGYIKTQTTASTLSPGLAARLSQDLSNAVIGFRPRGEASPPKQESPPTTRKGQRANQDDRNKAATLPISKSQQPTSLSTSNQQEYQDFSAPRSNSEASGLTTRQNHRPGTEITSSPGPQRPLPVRRAHNEPPGNVRGPPPRPPPKPSKDQIPEHFRKTSSSSDSKPPPPPPQTNKPQVFVKRPSYPDNSQDGAGDSGVKFAGSAEIIQRTTQMNIPLYLQQKYNPPPPAQVPYDPDSDSDSGPILYRSDDDDDPRNYQNYDDEDEDDDDSTVGVGGLASKVARRDTLAMRLNNRPTKEDLESRNIIPSPQKSDSQKDEVKINLTRRLSQRPSKEELQQRNILPDATADEKRQDRERVKRQLTRKLSMRPTVKELVERKVLNWHEYVEVYEVQNYDRRADKPWTRLTPTDKAMIRKELNDFKATEMEVHEESRRFTRFHKP